MIDVYAIPQDDYFEWEDIMDNNYPSTNSYNIPYFPSYQTQSEYNSCFKGVNLDKDTFPPLHEKSDLDWAYIQSMSNSSEPAIPLLNTQDEESSIDLNMTCSDSLKAKDTSKNLLFNKSRDDSAIMSLPTQNVDYLAYPWHKCEADLWASRRYLKAARNSNENPELEYQTYCRLRNASWRAIAAGRLKLKKVDPKSFHWNKEQDVTWLHGPVLKSISSHSLAEVQNFRNKARSLKNVRRNERPIKSILKHPSLSEFLLRGSSPSVKTRKRQIENTSEPETTRRKNLRFSSEVFEFADASKHMTRSTVVNTPIADKSLVHTDNSRNVNPKNTCIDPSFNCNPSVKYTIGSKQKDDSPSLRCRGGIELGVPESYTKHVSSDHLPVEQVSEDVAALSRAIREVVDAHQRGFQPQQYRVEIPLWPTITA